MRYLDANGVVSIAALRMALITGIALTTGPFFLLFPELGALSYEILGRPHGRWGSVPRHLVTSPALAGGIGILVTHYLPYGPVSVCLTVTTILTLISILRSPIGPAISAGVLPLTLGITRVENSLSVLRVELGSSSRYTTCF